MVTYYFSKCYETYPVSIIDAPQIVQILVEKWISHCGVLLEVHTDQERNFELDLLSAMRKQLKINKTRTTALQSVRQNGRMVQQDTLATSIQSH